MGFFLFFFLLFPLFLSLPSYLQESVSSGRTHVSPHDIPWSALRALLAESVYGGRIDNEFDQRLLQGALKDLFVPEAFNADFPLVQRWTAGSGEAATSEPLVCAPRATTQAQFLEWVSKLPSTQSPEWLGLPAAAESRMLALRGASCCWCAVCVAVSVCVCLCLRRTQGGGGGGAMPFLFLRRCLWCGRRTYAGQLAAVARRG